MVVTGCCSERFGPGSGHGSKRQEGEAGVTGSGHGRFLGRVFQHGKVKNLRFFGAYFQNDLKENGWFLLG